MLSLFYLVIIAKADDVVILALVERINVSNIKNPINLQIPRRKVLSTEESDSLSVQMLKLYIEGNSHEAIAKQLKFPRDSCKFRCLKLGPILSNFNQASARAFGFNYTKPIDFRYMSDFWIEELKLYALANSIKPYDLLS
jgi:hypothetical protein